MHGPTPTYKITATPLSLSKPHTHFMGAFPIVAALILVLSLVYQVNAKLITRYGKNGCDLFQGNWVYDLSYPLYNSADCPFIGKEFNCQNNGRPDNHYLKYRWKPSTCDLPRYIYS